MKQYQVPGLPGLLLSPRLHKTNKEYVACSLCCDTMQQIHIKQKGPPKFAIANGVVVGSCLKVFLYTDKHGIKVRTEIDIEQDVNGVLRALMAPIRPCCVVTTFFGGSH